MSGSAAASSLGRWGLEVGYGTVYCGPIDAFYDFMLGTLEYRSLRFETETLGEQDHQGVAVVNYTGSVEKVGVAPEPKRVSPASGNLEYG